MHAGPEPPKKISEKTHAGTKHFICPTEKKARWHETKTRPPEKAHPGPKRTRAAPRKRSLAPNRKQHHPRKGMMSQREKQHLPITKPPGPNKNAREPLAKQTTPRNKQLAPKRDAAKLRDLKLCAHLYVAPNFRTPQIDITRKKCQF